MSSAITITNLIKTDISWIVLGAIVLFVYLKFKDKFRPAEIFNFHYKNMFKTILLPVIISFALLSIFRFVTNQPLNSMEGIPFSFAFLSIVIIGPFFEELFLRGILLGGFIYFSEKVANKYASYFFMILGFIIQLSVFVWIHGSLNIVIRTSFLILIGLLYSLLFIFYKKNLLVPIIAHLSTNLFILLGIFN